MRFTKLRTAGRHFDLALVDFELHRTKPFVGQQRDTLDCVGQPLAIELNRLVVPLRDHPLIGRKLPIDHTGNQNASAHLEEQVVLTALKLNIALTLGEELAQLEQRLLREDHTDVLRDASLMFHIDEGKAVTVGGNQREALRLQNELRAVEEIPCVLARNRILRLRDHFLHGRARQCCTR